MCCVQCTRAASPFPLLINRVLLCVVLNARYRSTMASLFNAPFLVCSMLLIAHAFADSLTPPDGNSLKRKLKTDNGKYMYSCEKGKWSPVVATADLVNVSDYKESLGKYLLEYRPSNPGFAGIWTLTNTPADSAESGTPVSVVAGQVLASEAVAGAIPQTLMEASYHKYYGVASRVSYIQRLNTKGGLPPTDTLQCTETNKWVDFEAEFWFYTQDMVPPAVPAALAVPWGRMVIGFFCRGVAVYKFDGHQWQRTDVHGKLYDVPGGTYVGTYYVTAQTDKYGGNFWLQTVNPYAWSVVAKLGGHSVQVSPDSLPWSLFNITSSSGNTSILGPFSNFQMIATRGGLPPAATPTTAKGAVFKSIFTNVFWMYCSQ